MGLDKNHAINSKSSLEKTKRSRWVKFSYLGAGCILALIIGILGLMIPIVQFNLSSGTIAITDVVLTTGLDTQGRPLPPVSSFSPSQSRIYCVVFVSSPKPVNVRIKWYWLDKLIFEDAAFVNQWRAFYIEPLPGTEFPEGNYKLEISLISQPAITLYFSIE